MDQTDISGWPAGGGEMRLLIRSHDWTGTPLGAISAWPQSLKTAVDILLGMPMAAMLLWGEDGIMLYNDACATFSGTLHPAMLGSKAVEGLPAFSEFTANIMKVVLGGSSLNYRDQELPLSKDEAARRVWLNLDCSPVLDESSKPVAVLVIVTDTTARVHAERALLESEARMSAVFARAKVGLSEISTEGRFLRVNDELCRLLDRSRDELLGASIADVTLPEDLPRSLSAFQHLLQSGEPVTLDKRYMRPDGSAVWASSALSLLEHEEGNGRSVLAVTVDLTARKHAEQALAESESRFRALAEASPALIWQLDPGGDVIYLNPRHLDLTGESPERLDGAYWRAVLHPDDVDRYLEAINLAQRRREAVRAQVRVRGRTGEWHWLESHASPWFAPDGSYAGHVGISIDITDTVHAQEELAISSERLKLAIEGSGDGVWDWLPRTGMVVYSDRLKQMLGYAPEEKLNHYRDWEERVHPDDRQQVLATLEASLKDEKPSFVAEYRMRCKNGDWKWVMGRAVVVARDEQGQPLRMVGTLTDISEKRRSEEMVWRQANFDTLTGLPNRRLFRDRLEHDVKKAHRTGQCAALLFIDLDHFKEANDLLGHDVGDKLLEEGARRISACVRESDTVARVGGDEFTAILAELDDLAHVEMIAQKIIDALDTPFQLENEIVHLSASIGIALYPSDATTPDNLIRSADQAMYAAKSGGRNQFSYFTRSMQQEARTRLHLISDLRHALGGGELRVYYQPVVDLKTGRVVKAEALLRWQHPRLGLINPPRFIPFAEESGLINEIGEWVFMQAASRAQEWSGRLGKPFQVGVNRSQVQFQSRAQDADWGEYLASLGLPGNSITVEISENLLVNATAKVTDKLLQYRDAGIQVALDNFGTGYSSMRHLQQFDIDFLKIDPSLIQGADDGSRTVVRSIIAMAHELGLQAIAEGVETEAQRNMLVDAGCDFGQGFLFSPAVPAREFTRLMQ